MPSSLRTIGDEAFNLCYNLADAAIPPGVTSIGTRAFGYCRLTTVTIPPGLATMGNGIFGGNSYLTSVTIADGVTSIGPGMFGGCPLADVTIPDSVMSIDGYAFADTALTSVTIPEGVTSIGEWAFSNSPGLTSAVFLGDAPAMGVGVFANSDPGFTVQYVDGRTGFVTPPGPWVPTGTASEGSYTTAYYVPPPLTDGTYMYTIDNGQVTIVSYQGPPEPGALVIPSTLGGFPVATIGSGAFDSLRFRGTAVTIPEGVTSIGTRAFDARDVGDSNLTAVYMPSSLRTIGDNAFRRRGGLTDAAIPAGVTSIGSGAFSHCALTSVTVPPGITTVAAGAFSGNMLTSVTIPDGVTSIAGASSNPLADVTIPDSVMSIDGYAFADTALTSVTIPEGVTSIGEWAFSNSPGLTSAVFLGDAPAMGVGVFANSDPGFAVQYVDGRTGFVTPPGPWVPTGTASEGSYRRRTLPPRYSPSRA